MGEEEANELVAKRGAGYATPAELCRRSGLRAATLERLAAADAFGSMGLDRRQALWAVKALGEAPLPLFAAASMTMESPETPAERAAPLPPMRLGEHVAEDYATISMTLRRHPLAFLREDLARQGMVRAADLATLPVERRLSLAGLVLIRQRPGTASGVIFMTIEDETGIANIIVWPKTFERFRRVVLGASLLGCTGRLQRQGRVIHVVAERLVDLSHRLDELRRHPFPMPTSRGDEARHPPPAKPRYPGGAPRDFNIASRDFR